MIEFIENSVFFGAFISLGAYEIGLLMKRKFKLAIFNPLLISIFCVIGVLMILGIDYESYEEGGKYISYLLTPATVCLAVPLYQQLHLLKKNIKAIAAGIVSGVLASLVSVLLLAKLFGLSHEEYVTLLPKSITTAIIISTVTTIPMSIAIDGDNFSLFFEFHISFPSSPNVFSELIFRTYILLLLCL